MLDDVTDEGGLAWVGWRFEAPAEDGGYVAGRRVAIVTEGILGL